MTQDEELHHKIDALVAEEHALWGDPVPSPERSQRLAELGRQLDQAWDLLRRRQAAREFGNDPAAVHESSEAQVENYLQ